jgi:AcrR family transcriptional regulator
MTRPLRDSERTRAAILRSAQQAFAARGYAAVGLREITAAAGVNPALVSRYFGSKEKLFEAALAAALDVTALTGHPRAAFGAGLVAAFVTPAADRVNPLPILMLATSDPGAQAIADRLLREAVLVPLAAWFGRADAEHRAARVMALAGGFFTYRLLYPLDTWSGTLDPGSRAWLEQAFQSIVDSPV